jgi:hypothetical protein
MTALAGVGIALLAAIGYGAYKILRALSYWGKDGGA